MKQILTHVFLCLVLATSACSHFDESVAAYEDGDYATALWEWRRLARAGYGPALNNLGVVYYEGTGVPQDPAQAYQWFSLAASQGYRHALENRHVVAGTMTSAQFAEARRLTREWWMLNR
ncbi:MAG: hypothetical protein O3C34_00005 [Proteobacteria bacterium]|nr:hypothetical protein [Pseudomonadota bacterium]